MTIDRRAYCFRGAALGALLAAVLLDSVSGRAAEDAAAGNSLPPGMPRLNVGEKVPTFYVRAVTGSLKNKSVCYVCRNGERPVVMIFVREITPELVSLLQQVDELVDRHRADGLRAFGVFPAGDSKDLLPRIQTLAFDNRLNLPLTISAAIPDGPVAGAPVKGAFTVVLYRDQTVVHQASFQAGELNAEKRAIVAGLIRKLAVGADADVGQSR